MAKMDMSRSSVRGAFQATSHASRGSVRWPVSGCPSSRQSERQQNGLRHDHLVVVLDAFLDNLMNLFVGPFVKKGPTSNFEQNLQDVVQQTLPAIGQSATTIIRLRWPFYAKASAEEQNKHGNVDSIKSDDHASVCPFLVNE